MIDVVLKKPLRVETEGKTLPTITLPADQLEVVKRLLDSHGVRYGVSEDLISWEGSPFEAYIYLERKEDPAAVQAILDSVP